MKWGNNMKSLATLIFAGIVSCTWAKGIIDPSLNAKFLGGEGGNENVLVSFDQSIQTVFDQVNSMNFTDDEEKRTVQTRLQQTFTQQSQAGLQSLLRTQGIPFESFWISNKMVVKNASPGLVNTIASVPGVSKVEKEPVGTINIPLSANRVEDLNATRTARQNWVAWGVQKIRADQVWQTYSGRGIVVANIDSGVRYTHLALRNRYRQNYGWYDPYERTELPNDQNGHGTHTMGTIAGEYNLGVAPGATWIACKGCNGQGQCVLSALYYCGQWIQCPTDFNGQNQQCNLAPKIVSNSWQAGNGNWYDDIIRSWRNSGIIPVFSVGNSGPNCNTAVTPGNRQGVIAVGSTDSNERISSFSSLGPAPDGNIKPEIAAPGGDIPSAWHTSDTAMNTISGTSMACPHVSGVIALMSEKVPGLTFNQAFVGIAQTAVRSTLDTTTARTCGGRRGNQFPNNVFGYGRIDAVDSVNSVSA